MRLLRWGLAKPYGHRSRTEALLQGLPALTCVHIIKSLSWIHQGTVTLEYLQVLQEKWRAEEAVFHRVLGWLGLEGTLKRIQFQPTASFSISERSKLELLLITALIWVAKIFMSAFSLTIGDD